MVLDAKAGLVLTTYSLIDGARKIFARSSTGVGCYADITAADARADLAVLKLLDPPARLGAVPIFRGRTTPTAAGDGPNIVKGMAVVALGHPAPANAADGKPVAGFGTITEVRKRWPSAGRDAATDSKLKPLGQFAVLVSCDVRVTHSCPGAALVNLEGELVALGSPALGVSGPDAGGYAVPMDVNFRRIVDVLMKGREVEYGFLGVYFDQRRGGRRPRAGGLTISKVTPGGPAALAGLQGGPGGFFGDTIVAVDGTPLDEEDDLFLGRRLRARRLRSPH